MCSIDEGGTMTSTALATFASAPQLGSSYVNQLLLIQQQIPDWDADSCLRFINSNKLFKEWSKLHEDVEDILTELERTKAITFRRLGQIGNLQAITTNTYIRSYSKRLGAMDETEFATFLSRLSGSVTVRTLFLVMQQEATQTENIGVYTPIFTGEQMEPFDPLRAKRRHERLREAAAEIIGDALANDESFTNSEIVERIAQTVGIDIETPNSPTELWGIGLMVRSALDYETIETNVGDGYLPCVVTYLTDEGYVRVPIQKAKLKQFDAMVKWRKSQLDNYINAFDNLKSAYDAAYQACNGDMEALIPLKKLGHNYVRS